MKYIQLTQGKVTIVDDEDFEELNKLLWRFQGGYAARLDTGANGKRISVRMHREIMKTPENLEVDHINGNKLDNRKENLRNCTAQNNLHNKPIQKNNKTGMKGVFFIKKTKKFIAQIGYNGKHYHIGTFKTLEEASEAYITKAKLWHGEFLNLEKFQKIDNQIQGEIVSPRPKTRKNNTSGYIGVKKSDVFMAQITVNYKSIYLGRYLTAIEAAHAYNLAAIKYFGEKATLNAIDENEIKKYLPLKQINSGRPNTTTGFRGVCIMGKKFSLRFRKKHIGLFDNAIDAAKEYNKLAINFWGEKAKLNIIPE